MDCETTNVSKKLISTLFRVHPNTVDGWIKAGLPHHKEGREYRFDLSEVISWHHAFVSNIVGDIPSLSEAKRRKEHYQSELKRLQFEVAEGKLLDIEVLKKLWIPVVGAMRSKLLAMPSKLTLMIFGCKTKPEIYSCLKKAIDEALTELSDERMYLKSSKKTKKVRK